MRKLILAAIIIGVGFLAGCAGTTGNPSSEVGNPNPNGGVELEPLRSISLGGGYELRIREGWQASDVGGAFEVRDDSGSLLFTADATDDASARSEFLRCPSYLMAWASVGTAICRMGDRLIVGKKDPALLGGGGMVVVIVLQAGVGTNDFSVATTEAAAAGAGAASQNSGSLGMSLPGTGDKCANAPAGTPGCDDGPIGIPGDEPSATPDGKGEAEGLLSAADITLTIPILHNAGDDGDSLCLFYLIDDPGDASLADLQAQGRIKGRTCLSEDELAVGVVTAVHGVLNVSAGTLLADIHHILARVHNEGGAPFTIMLEQVQAISGAVSVAFTGPPVPLLSFDETFFKLHLGE